MSGKNSENGGTDLELYARDGVNFIQNWIVIASKVQPKGERTEIALILSDRRGIYESDGVVSLPPAIKDKFKDDDFVYWTLQEVTLYLQTLLKMELVTDAEGFWNHKA